MPTVDTFMTYSGKPAHLTAPTQDTMEVSPVQAGAFRTSNDLEPQKIANKREDKDVQRMFTNASNKLMGLSAIGTALLSFAAMVAVRMWRGMHQAIAVVSSSGHGIDMSIPMVPVSLDKSLDLESQGSCLRIPVQALQGSERALAKHMHADIKSPFALWHPLGLGESELQYGRVVIAAVFFVSTQKPRPMNTLMLAHDRQDRIKGAEDAGEIHDIIANEKLDKHDSVEAVVQLSKMGRGSVVGGKKWVRLYDLVRSCAASYGPYQAVWALHGYAKLRRRRLAMSLVPLEELGEAVARVALYMTSRQVAMAIWAYGALGVPPTPQVIDELEATLRHKVTDMIGGGRDPLNPQGFATTIWAYSKFGLWPTPSTLDALKQVAGGLIRRMDPQAVANTFYGYAALPRTASYDTRDTVMSDVPLLELEEAIERVAPHMTSQHVANTIWAYGTLGVPPSPQVIAKLEAALCRVVTDMIPQHMSNIIWAYSKFGLRPMPETLDALKHVAKGLVPKMRPQEVSNTLYGYAALPPAATSDTRYTAMSVVPLAELEEAIERVAPDMNSQGVANTIWAYGALGLPPTRRVAEKLEAALRRVVTDMIPQGLSNIIWAYSKLGLRPMSVTLDALEQVADGLISKMGPQEVSNTLYGYAALPRAATFDTRDAVMSEVPLAGLEAAIERVASEMNSQEVANTIWAYGTLGVPPSRGVIDELEAALRRVVTDMIPMDFSSIIYAYSKFGLQPMPETVVALKQVAEGLVLEMNPQQVSKTLHGYAALARRPRISTDCAALPRLKAMSGVPLAELEEAIQVVAPEMNSQGVANKILRLHEFSRDSDFSSEHLCTESREELFV
jgi:hypothetical protein